MRKRIYFTILITLMVFVLTATMAYAWSFGDIKDWVVDNALNTALTAIFMLIAGFFGGSKVGKVLLAAKLPIFELKDVAVKVHNARRPTSAGGKQITDAEKDEILAEVEELIASVVKVFGKGK